MATYRRYRNQVISSLLLVSLSAFPLSGLAASPYDLFPQKQNKFGYLGFQSKWHTQWFLDKERYLGGHWDTSLSRGVSPAAYSSVIPSQAPLDLGFTAVLRYQRHDGTGFYAEAGTGPQYQTVAHDWAGRPQGSRMSMNTSAGIGFIWKNGVDLGFKASYLSRIQRQEGTEGGSGVIGVGLSYRW
ncbi:hypothetical protein EDC30_11682 [Paucimonas lemoignei]|uniref:Outer membrane protein beta-barrel domain-containing protein n=1 Tax=Paucimonas lemoignei TaxID=29443 RepID=A0A4R3HUM2_PAULE|nr:hypothetical protein [Paucimonas lemoignei]TCS33550.1 hypothetical protein EDC30_11682 [Paucimonas lemoignei]